MRNCHYRIKNGPSVQKHHQARRMWHILFNGQVKNLLTSTAYQAGFDKCICERCVKKAKGQVI
jgi:hypothetical protein